MAYEELVFDGDDFVRDEKMNARVVFFERGKKSSVTACALALKIQYVIRSRLLSGMFDQILPLL